MTTDDLDRLRSLAAAATPGPWTWLHGKTSERPYEVEAEHKVYGAFASSGRTIAEIAVPDLRGLPPDPQPEMARKNADFIAALDPQTALALLDAAALGLAYREAFGERYHLGFPLLAGKGTYDTTACIVKREWLDRVAALAARLEAREP